MNNCKNIHIAMFATEETESPLSSPNISITRQDGTKLEVPLIAMEGTITDFNHILGKLYEIGFDVV